MKRTLCALMIMSVVAVSALSAESSLQGFWIGEMQSDAGAQAIQMSIRVDDDARVSGSIISQGSELSIQEAVLNGNVLEFVTMQRRDDPATTFHWTGIIDGDDISFSCSGADQNAPALQFVAHRRK